MKFMKKVKVASIRVRKYRYLLKSKKIIFKVLIKLSVLKEEIHRPEKCSCRSWSRSPNSDFGSAEPQPKELLLRYQIQTVNTKRGYLTLGTS
jgi:hypothetical protein